MARINEVSIDLPRKNASQSERHESETVAACVRERATPAPRWFPKPENNPKRIEPIATPGDPKFRNRILWAIAFSIAAHEIIAGLWPHQPSPPQAPQIVAERVTISKATPKPTPKPTPRPTPRPTPKITPAPHYTVAPHIVVRNPAAKAAATPTHKLGGAAAHKHIVIATPPPSTPKPAPPVSLAEGTNAGQQNGGTGTGAGAGAGTGGLGGSGTGAGTAGEGNGGDANTAPCGFVVLEPVHMSVNRDGSQTQTVTATIKLRDGTSATAAFPYTFYYRSDAENPFNHDEMLVGGGVPVQQPPSGSDISKMSPTIQAVLAHTDPLTGRTTFSECPPGLTAPPKGKRS
jgi:hypothetical protein